MSGFLDRLRMAALRFVEHGSESATPERALMMRRARGFGVVAFAVMLTAMVTALLIGRAFTAYTCAGGIIVYGVSIHCMSRSGGRWAPLAANFSIGYLMASIALASYQIGGTTPSATLYPSLLILGCMHVLGIRTAAVWTAVALVCLAFLTYTAPLPPPAPGAPEIGPGIIFSTRSIVLIGVFALSAMGRRFEDKATAQLQYMARHDPLTGLCNRRELDQRIGDAVARAARYRRRPALLFIDLDGFKQVNDHYGHTVGDEVLRGVADAIQAQTRRTDAAGRLGGDEFVVLLEDAADEKTAASYAQRLLERLAASEEGHVAPVSVRASVGVALYPDDGQDVESLTRAADMAMYAAKRSGGACILLASALRREKA